MVTINCILSCIQEEDLNDPKTGEEPAKVLAYTKKYEHDTDIFLEFFDGSEYQITNNKKDFENINEVYDVFKGWFKDTHGEGNKHNKKEFTEYLSTSDRFESDKRYIYGIKFNNIDDKQNAIDK